MSKSDGVLDASDTSSNPSSALRAIDLHAHVPKRDTSASDPRLEQKKKYFRSSTLGMSLAEMVDLYRRLRMKAVIFEVDKTPPSAPRSDGNDYVAEVAIRFPDVFIGWASINPWKGAAAVVELERSVGDLKLRGLKLHPITQEFFPDDRRIYPLYEAAQALGIPVMFHTGHTGIGAGTPGGGGMKLKYSRPIPHLDDVAADFPGLTIIGAHPSWPWQEEMLSVALHKSNVFIDLSGWSPKYFAPSLVQFANTLLQDKVMFGSDFPAISPERWLADFEAAPFREEVRSKILLTNASLLLERTKSGGSRAGL